MSDHSSTSAADDTRAQFIEFCKTSSYTISESDSSRCTMALQLMISMHVQFILTLANVMNSALPNTTMCKTGLRYSARIAVAILTRFMRIKHSETLCTMCNNIYKTTTDQYSHAKTAVRIFIDSLNAKFQPLYEEEMLRVMQAATTHDTCNIESGVETE